MNIVKKYTNGDLTVVWQPKMCIHSEKCFKGLPRVFNPKRRPWVEAEAADIETIVNQIKQCPSGALSYELKNQTEEMADPNEEVKVQVFQDGPLIVHGPMEITHNSGDTERKDKQVAFCRCGSSGNKPYCDGSHKKVGFSG